MTEPDPIPESLWTPEYRAFRARWDRAERWWPWFKRLHHVGSKLMMLSCFGSLLDLLFSGPDDWTAFKYLILPGGILAGAILGVGHGIGEGVIRVQRRALNDWEPQNDRYIDSMRIEIRELREGKR